MSGDEIEWGRVEERLARLEAGLVFAEGLLRVSMVEARSLGLAMESSWCRLPPDFARDPRPNKREAGSRSACGEARPFVSMVLELMAGGAGFCLRPFAWLCEP